ncbi:MAG: hypothetical protein LUE14_02925 [Clostridiales bacterium]|nr:hypothetical protein [Clostridiales bacterium]
MRKTDKLLRDSRQMGLHSSDLIREAKNIDRYGAWAYMSLLGYTAEEVRKAAAILRSREAH